MQRNARILTISLAAWAIFVHGDFAVQQSAQADPPAPAGRSYYIAPTGSDRNPGTLAAPWSTLVRFFLMARPGDTAYIRAGTYDGSKPGWGDLTPAASGTAAAPITVTNYMNEAVAIDTGQASGNITCFVTLSNGNSYLTFRGLRLAHFKIGFNLQTSPVNPRLRPVGSPNHIVLSKLDIGYAGHYPTDAQDGWGIFMGPGTHDVTVSRCDIHHVAGPGIGINGNADHISIVDTQIHDTSGDSGSDGIDVDVQDGRHATYLTFTGDAIWNTSDDGFDIKGDHVTLTNCVAHGIARCGYKCWSPATQPGEFTLDKVVGYDVGETVIRGIHAPHLTITNSSFRNSGAGETTFIYDGGQAWGGKLNLANNRFYYTGTIGYAAAADIQKRDTALTLDGDQFHNANNVNNGLILRDGPKSATTFANSAFNDGCFTKATGLEPHGRSAMDRDVHFDRLPTPSQNVTTLPGD